MKKHSRIPEEFSYVAKESSEYNEKNASEFRDFLRHCTEVKPLNLSTITVDGLRQILDRFHQIVSEPGASQEDRKFIMQLMMPGYDLKRALNRAKAYQETPDSAKVFEGMGTGMKHGGINLRACGFPEKAEVYEKHLQNYFMRESLIAGALEALPESRVEESLKNGTFEQLSKEVCSSHFQQSPGMLTAIDAHLKTMPKTQNIGEMLSHLQKANILPTNSLKEISEHSHQRANILVVKTFGVKDFTSWRQSMAPVYFLYDHPMMINPAFTVLVAELNKHNKVMDPIDLAAAIHCQLQSIHVYSGANKRVSRAMMNVILLLSNLSPVEFKTELEIEAYLIATYHPLFHKVVVDVEKSQYNPGAFSQFLRNKIKLSEADFEKYLRQDFMPRHKKNLGVGGDIARIVNDKSGKAVEELASSLQSLITQKPPKSPVVTDIAESAAGISFFKPPKAPSKDYANIKPSKHFPALQKKLEAQLDDIIAKLNIKTTKKTGATKQGWSVFSTNEEGCCIAQINCLDQSARQQLKDHLEGKVEKTASVNSKNGEYPLRVYFREDFDFSCFKQNVC